MQETLSNFSKYKFITVINIVLTIFLSYLIYNSVFMNTKVNTYIHFLNFDTDYTYPSEINIKESQIITSGRAKDDLQEKLNSYTNFQSWLDFNNLNEDEFDYTQFLNLKVKQGKIAVSEKNTNSATIVLPINLISDYIRFSINYLNYVYSIKIQKLIDFHIDKYICDNVQGFLELKTVKEVNKQGNNSTLDQAFTRSLDKLMECNEHTLDTSNFTFVQSLSLDFANSYKQEFMDLDFYKFISISDIKIQTQSLNNLSILNIYTTSIILLIVSLTFQNIVMIYLERKK